MSAPDNVIADYRVLRELGRGASTRALLVEPPARLELGEPCVLKVIDRPVADDDFRRVVDELRVVASLRGARVIELFEAGIDHGRPFIAQRFHPEGSLDQTPSLPLHAVLRAVADAAQGVHALHEVGLVHRQITPGNVLLVGGRARIAEPSLAPLFAPGMTSTGLRSFGSLAFLEPEVIWGEPAGRSTDVWALGVTLHQSLGGAALYPDLPEGNTAQAFQHVLGTRPSVDASLPVGAREVIERCIAPRRADRFATAFDVARSIERFLPDGDVATVDEPDVGDDVRFVSLVGFDPASLPERAPLPTVATATADDLPGSEDVIVQGIRCARGHLNNPASVICARCRVKLMASADGLVDGVRPPLGVLTFDDGDTYVVARDTVIGREPGVDPDVASGRAIGVRLTDTTRTVSRAHALLRLVEWELFLEDRGSSNGTFVRLSGDQPWQRVEPGARVALVAGATIRLGERELAFEHHSLV
jgi:hypothetical protein